MGMRLGMKDLWLNLSRFKGKEKSVGCGGQYKQSSGHEDTCSLWDC